MIIKKHKGKPYGAVFTAAEEKAMKLEINRQLVEANRKANEDIDALVLYTLAEGYGWRRKRLRKFWNKFKEVHKDLCEYYMMDEPGDNEWLAHRKLKQIGVDVHEWYLEDKRNEQTVL